MRIKTESTLLQAVVPDSFFSEHHSRLLRADLSSFMGALRSAGAPITVEKLLHQKKLTRKKTWGFSLGIADWSFVGKDSETLEEVVQRQMDGSQRISFLGQRGYEGRWIQDTFTWIADFDAQMTGFSREPTADQFRFGLRLKWSWSEKALTGTARDFRSFTAGARLLREAIDHRWTHTHIQEAFRKMRPLWTQSLQMRALGVYLLALIQTSDVVQPEAVERSFKISFGKTGETLLFTTSQHRT